MLYPGLEKLIQKGKAQYHTFCIGASGVGTIPCPEGSFVILTDFDWFPFIDVPPLPEDAPATGSIGLNNSVLIVNTVQFDFPGFPSLGPVPGIDFSSQVNTQNAINLALAGDPNFIGWSCNVQYQLDPFNPANAILTFIWTTNTPGAVYNGIFPGFFCGDPVAPVLVITQAFSGGVDGVITFQDLLDRSVHQLEFKSMKSRNHYIIRDDVSIGITGDNSQGIAPSVNVTGKFHRDIYLVHTDNVQINILNVPPVSAWATNYSQLPAKSQEFNAPSGYGQGAVGFPAVRETVFDSAGNTQQYINLTQFRDDIAVIAGQNRNEFKVDVNLLNILGDPTQAGKIETFVFNGPNYPILNIGYVLVKMNYNEFVNSSNG